MCDVICNEAVPFRPYCPGVATRTQNVSEYMLILALCLVTSASSGLPSANARARVCVCSYVWFGSEIAPPDPTDMLPRAKCEDALRAVRQARWFEVLTCPVTC